MTNQQITLDKMLNNLADNIMMLLEERGIQQKELCEAIGITRTSLYNYTSGISLPKPENLYSIARFFNVKVSDLFK